MYVGFGAEARLDPIRGCDLSSGVGLFYCEYIWNVEIL